MCDTMVALGNTSRDGRVYFAKNSDRHPNEPHILIQVPRQYYSPGEKLRCTYIEVEQEEETYAVMLLKPSWIWGCEMGCNEFGLNIGNEAVFTREKYGEPRLTGMDMIRLALERCQTCQEAVNQIVELLERYGQGGNCGYEKPFTYHNSFLIADTREAWVLETAGQYWAAEKVRDIRSISNGLTIGSSFDRSHPDLISHAIEKRWCRNDAEFNFASCYKDPLFTRFSGSEQRRQCSQLKMQAELGKIDVPAMVSILRSHHPAINERQFQRASLQSVCMHAGGLIGDHTTGSYVASLGKTGCTYWITGASTPCLAMFKPLWFIDNHPILFGENEEEQALAFWHRREVFHRMVINGQIKNLTDYYIERDRLEAEWLQTADKFDNEGASMEEKRDFMVKAWQQEDEVIESFISQNESRTVRPRGNIYFRHYWHQQNERLGKPGKQICK